MSKVYKYEEFVNEELFGLGNKLSWMHNPEESSMTVIQGDKKWKVTDSILKSSKEAHQLFMRLSDAVKGKTTPEEITKLIKSLFRFGEVQQLA